MPQYLVRFDTATGRREYPAHAATPQAAEVAAAELYRFETRGGRVIRALRGGGYGTDPYDAPENIDYA